MAQTRTAKVRGGAKATIDHDEIRRWVEGRDGQPAVVKGTTKGNQPGILRINFPGFSGEDTLEPLSWDEWFERFERTNLAFLFQDETGSGRPSRFNKLVGRETVEVSPPGRAKRATKRSVPRRWAKKGARTRAELSRAESRTQGKSGGRTGRRGQATGRTTKQPRAAGSSSTKPAVKRGSSTKRAVKRGSSTKRAVKRGSSRARAR